MIWTTLGFFAITAATLWLHLERGSDARSRRRRAAVDKKIRALPAPRLNVPGEDLGKVVYEIADVGEFTGRNVLVVGGGDPAVEAALELAEQDGTTVTLSCQQDALARLTAPNQTMIEQAVKGRHVTVLLQSRLREIRDDVVVVDVGGEARIMPNDDVIVRTGTEPALAFLERIGIRMVPKELPVEPDVERAG